jgi:hypothetical protein
MMRIWIVLIAIGFIGCDSEMEYRELRMPVKNPTLFVFNAPMASIKTIIKQNRQKMPLSYMESADDSSIFWGKGLLSAAENKNDFYLRDMAPAETSLVYHGSGRPVVYDYDLHIHLTQLDSNRTRVEIVTIKPKILLGVRFPYNVLPIESSNAGISKEVSPSTIEEYRVLLVIGEALGIKDSMPATILPEQSSN